MTMRLHGLSQCINEEEKILESGTNKEYNEWLNTKKREFRKFRKNLKSEREGNKNAKIRSFEDILENMVLLLEEIDNFPPNIQKRLKMMDKQFIELTNFCSSNKIPTTNNMVENYFFRTLNLGWKKRMKTDKGLIVHLKLQLLRILGTYKEVKIRLPELFSAIRLISQ